MEAAPAPMAEAVIALPSAPLSSLPAPAPRKLRDRVIEALRVRHYSLATEADDDWLTVTPESAAADNLSYWTDDDGE